MKHIKSTVILLFLVLLAGCIKENRDDCGRTTLRFSYVGDGTTEIFLQKMKGVDLYVFDEKNQCIFHHRLEQNEMKNQMKQMVLNQGKYRVVCIGNPLDETETKGVHSGDFNEMYCTHPNSLTGKNIQTYDALYHASIEIEVPASRQLDVIVPFTAAHYDVCVEVKGYLPVTEGNKEAPKLKLDQLSQSLNFNKITSDETTTLHPAGVNEKGLYRYHFNILRQVEKPELALYNDQGEVIFTMKLADFLANHPEIDLKKEELLIPILIEFHSVGVEVTVPDWAVENLKPEF